MKARRYFVPSVAVVAIAAGGACTLLGGSFEIDPSLDIASAPSDSGAVVPDAGTVVPEASVCGDVRSDRKNCGACGVDCLGGQCLEGRCTPYDLGEVEGAVGDLAVFQNDVWLTTTFGDGGGAITRIKGDGTVVPDVTNGRAGTLPSYAAVAQFQSGFVLYWTSSFGKTSEIRRCTLPECADTKRLYADDAGVVATLLGIDGDPEGVVSTGRVGRVVACRFLTGECAASFYEPGGPAAGFALAAVNRRDKGFKMAFAALGDSRIVTMADFVTGSPMRDVAQKQATVNGLALDGDNLVWVGVDAAKTTAEKGYIRRCVGTAIPCARVEELAVDAFEPTEVAILGDILVWASVFPNGQPFQGGTIQACKLSEGCKPVTVVATGETAAHDITGDENALVWRNGERAGSKTTHHIRRVVRPLSQRP